MSVCLSLICAAWISAAKLPVADVLPALQQWLHDSGSMTQRLRNTAKNIHIKVLQHKWQEVDQDSAEYLHVSSESQAIYREVIIYGDDKPLIYAVSIFPETIVASMGSQLLEQGEKPLGDILFSRPDLNRSEFQFAKLDAEQAKEIYKKASFTLPIHYLWARRSKFSLQGGKLSVLEVFLPALIEKIQ